MTLRARIESRAAVAVVILVGTTACTSSSSGASCAGPSVDVGPQPVAAGSGLHLDGRFFFADCYDTGQLGTPPASTDIVVTFSQGKLEQVLTTLDAAPDGSLNTKLRVPGGAVPGPATVTVGSAEAVVQVAAG